ncbi:hypothetical protein NUACC21_82080 [Scytonema sp. NUACC21]
MKKVYEAPKLLNHGSISEITALTGGSTRTDFLFGANGQPTGITDQGSFDACIIRPGAPTPGTKCKLD